MCSIYKPSDKIKKKKRTLSEMQNNLQILRSNKN